MKFEFPNLNSEQQPTPPQEKPKQMGGELREKSVQGPDGQWYNKFGEKITTDEAYASMFWEKQPKGMRETMINIIRDSEREGMIAFLSAQEGITQDLKEKLSAYRLLAKELGYEVGEFAFKAKAGTVTAQIRKIEAVE